MKKVIFIFQVAKFNSEASSIFFQTNQISVNSLPQHHDTQFYWGNSESSPEERAEGKNWIEYLKSQGWNCWRLYLAVTRDQLTPDSSISRPWIDPQHTRPSPRNVERAERKTERLDRVREPFWTRVFSLSNEQFVRQLNSGWVGRFRVTEMDNLSGSISVFDLLVRKKEFMDLNMKHRQTNQLANNVGPTSFSEEYLLILNSIKIKGKKNRFKYRMKNISRQYRKEMKHFNLDNGFQTITKNEGVFHFWSNIPYDLM